jgi:AraC-like DNA-binding protein
MRYSFKNKDRSLPVYIDSIGFDWAQEDVNRPKGYPYVHWLQTCSGKGIVTLKDREIELTAGQGILINQEVPHDYAKDPKSEEWRTSYFTFGGSLIKEMTMILGIQQYQYIDAPEEKLKNFIAENHQEFERPQVDIYRSSLLVYDFLLEIKKYQVKNPSNKHLHQKIIQPILSLIETNYMDDLSNEDFVKATNYSIQYILETFRRIHGESPHQALTKRRILKAKELLLNRPELSVEEVGRSVGFNTNSYFISTFKHDEYVTPGKFRNLYK